MSAATPTRPRRRILLAVAGLSPQVITETVFALAQAGDRAALPTEVHALTTADGAERIRLTLLSRQPGWFRRLLRQRRLPAITFRDDHIHIIRDRRGRPLSDIRTPEENDCLADQVTSLVRGFTSDQETQLHVSLAGGRKTMGFYAGYALSLYGRPQDRLSHVLVSAPFESHPDFYFPAARPRTIYDRDRRPLDASAARVTLAEIPFVRLRERMSEKLIRGRAGFSATVAALNRAQAVPALRLDLDARQVQAGAAELRLAPRELAFYLWFARRARAHAHGVSCPKGLDLELARAYLTELDRFHSRASASHRRLQGGMDAAFFSETKSRLHAALARAGAGPQYQLQRRSHPNRPAEFHLALPPAAITIVPDPEVPA